jgi:hypothetical protein
MKEELGLDVSMTDVKEKLKQNFEKVFHAELATEHSPVTNF